MGLFKRLKDVTDRAKGKRDDFMSIGGIGGGRDLDREFGAMPPRDDGRLRMPQTQAGIYTLPFSRQQLLDPRPTPTDPKNLMGQLSDLYSRTIMPYLTFEGTQTATQTPPPVTGGGTTTGGGVLPPNIQDIIDRREIKDDIRDIGDRRFPPLDIPGIGDGTRPPFDIPFDRDELIKDIREGITLPPPINRDELRDELLRDMRESITLPPPIDRDKLIEDIRGGINIPKPPSIDREALIEDIRSGIDIPKPPSIDREALTEDILSRINIPSREDFMSIARESIDIPTRFDPSGIQSRLDALEGRDIPVFDPTNLQQQIDLLSQRPTVNVDSLIDQVNKLERGMTENREMYSGLAQLLPTMPESKISQMDTILDDMDSRFSPSLLGRGMGRVG